MAEQKWPEAHKRVHLLLHSHTIFKKESLEVIVDLLILCGVSSSTLLGSSYFLGLKHDLTSLAKPVLFKGHQLDLVLAL